MNTDQKTESFDLEIQKDLNRSESEGYAVMYQSQKNDRVEHIKEEVRAKSGGPKMKIKDIMTVDPTCCTPDAHLSDVAQMMMECDCGEIPVVNNQYDLKPVGVITDRDIVCRAVAQGRNPLELTARDCMSEPCVTIRPEATVEECCRLLEEHQIRRIPVVDERGACCGMVAQADLATHAPKDQVADVLQEISEPRGSNGGSAAVPKAWGS